MGYVIKEIPQHVLDKFYYDETSPSFLRWRVRPSNWSKLNAGDVAGCLKDFGYWEVAVDRSVYKVHRIVYKLHDSTLASSEVIDHLDNNRSNNKITNLRKVSTALNTRNRKKSIQNTSGTTGVSKQGGNGRDYVWVASARLPNGNRIRKSYSISKYGDDIAFKMATEKRAELLALANEYGAGYTETHGK